LIIFGYLSFTTVRGKIGLNSCEGIKFLNIANFLAFHVWGKRILSNNDTTFFLHLFFLFCFCNATFFNSGYIIKPPQPSSAIYGAPPLTEHPSLVYNESNNGNGLLFHMTQPTSRSTIKAESCENLDYWILLKIVIT